MKNRIIKSFNTKSLWVVFSFIIIILFQLMIVNMLGANAFLGWISAIIWLTFGLIIFKREQLFFILFFIFYYIQTTAIISGAYIESGTYITEQNVYSYATGSTTRLVLYSLVYLLAAFIFLKLFIQRDAYNFYKVYSPLNNWIVKGIFGFSILILLIDIIGLLKFGSPLVLGVDRFIYWNQHPFPQIQTALGQGYFISFLLGIIFVSTKEKKVKKYCLIIILINLICLVFYGNKYSALFQVLFYFLLPIFIVNVTVNNKKISLYKTFFSVIVFFLCIIPILMYHYGHIYGASSASDRIINRIFALQGHLWWGVDRLVNNNVNDSYQQLVKEFGAFFSLTESNEVGMPFLMRLVAPPKIADAFIDQGTDFTMGYPAIGLYLFGYIGLFFLQILMALITVLCLKYLMMKIIKKQLVRAAIGFKIFLIVYATQAVGNLYFIFSVKTCLYIYLVLIIELIASQRFIRKKIVNARVLISQKK